MADYEEVERPTLGLYAAIRRTAETGGAVRVAHNGRPHLVDHAAFTRAGFTIHQRRDGDYLVMWAERIAPRNGAGA